MMGADAAKALAITSGIQAWEAASIATRLFARLFGDHWRMTHLKTEFRLSRWRGAWYCTGVWQAAP